MSELCTFDGCSRKRKYRLFCNGHYEQVRLGRPVQALGGVSETAGLNLRERFDHYVNKTAGCWIWVGSGDPNGYGQFWDGKRLVSAHRFAYQMHAGSIRPDAEIDHICHNRRCVNPSHLHEATRKENGENLLPRRDSRTGVRGVSWDSKRRKWRVQVTSNRVNHYVGTFEELEDAERAAIAKRNEFFTNNLLDRRTA